MRRVFSLDLSFYWILLRTNLRASFALRGAFLMQAGFMALNNLLFFVIWWILFDRFEDIRGWRIDDFAALYGIAAGGYGIAAVLAGGVHELARRIDDGALDHLLTQPRSVLVQTVGSKTRSDGWGDFASAIVLLGLGGHLTLAKAPWIVVALALAATTFVASGILIHSAAFWLQRLNALARQATEFLIAFSVYPPSLFGGALKVLLFTVVPAGFVSYLPVDLVRAFDPWTLLAAVAGTSAYLVLAVWVFGRGLRRYESGNRFGVVE